MRRQLLAPLIGTALAVAVAAPALADTTEPAAAYDVFVSGVDFTFTDKAGIDWEGFAQVEDNRTTGEQSVSFYFGGRGTKTSQCGLDTPNDPSDDYEGSSYMEFFSTDGRAVVDKIETDLSHAKVNLQLNGTRVSTDPCTGEIVSSTNEHHTFMYDLDPTSTPVPDVETFCRPDGAGGRVLVTERNTFVDATGDAKLDGKRTGVPFADLQRGQSILGAAC